MSEAATLLTEALGRLLEERGEPATDADAVGGELWRTLSDMGLPTLLLNESAGGAGAGLAEAHAAVSVLAARGVGLPVAETILGHRIAADAGLALEDEAVTHAEIDRRRSIRAYPRASFSAAKLREAVKIESEAGTRPALLIVEGFDFAAAAPGELADFKALAQELGAEMWHSAGSDDERISGLPEAVAPAADTISVIVALEPDGDHVALRALKDHDNRDLSALHEPILDEIRQAIMDFQAGRF